MNRIFQIIALARTRTGLIVIIGLLVALNLGRVGVDKYYEVLDTIDSKQALLGQYRITTQNIDSLRQRIKTLDARKRQFDSHLFIGSSRDEITSAMQIKLQETLGLAGLTPESLRPVAKGKADEEEYYGEVIINIRLTGELENFLKFISSLYKMNYYFIINNFTLKPFKNNQLKVFLELKGFYRIAGDGL